MFNIHCICYRDTVIYSTSNVDIWGWSQFKEDWGRSFCDIDTSSEKYNLSNTVIQVSKSHVFMSSQSRVTYVLF